MKLTNENKDPVALRDPFKSDHPFTKFPITLTQEEYQQLIFALGIAAGTEWFGQTALRLMNAVHRNDPNWTPYKVELTAPC
jgi:hypothetical protein